MPVAVIFRPVHFGATSPTVLTQMFEYTLGLAGRFAGPAGKISGAKFHHCRENLIC